MNTSNDYPDSFPEHYNPEDEIIEHMESIVSNIHITEDNEVLHDLSIADSDLHKIRKVSDLLDTDKPLIPIPIDLYGDTIYTTRVETRCVLCKSPWRERAEHWYLEHGRIPNSVVNFFRTYFNATVSWDCVNTHMVHHCDLERLSKDGLLDLEIQESVMARWRYRELDLAITGTLAEISDLRGLSCKHKPDLMVKRASLLNQLYAKLVDYKKTRDELNMGNTTDIGAVLMDVYKKVPDKESKDIILNKVKELREQYS